MNVSELTPSFTGRTPFRLSDNLRVPQSPGCYAIANIYDDVLYIGQSSDLSRRMSEHLNNPRMTKPTILGLEGGSITDYGLSTILMISRIDSCSTIRRLKANCPHSIVWAHSLHTLVNSSLDRKRRAFSSMMR